MPGKKIQYELDSLLFNTQFTSEHNTEKYIKTTKILKKQDGQENLN